MLTEACARLDFRCKTKMNYEFGGEPRLPQIMFTEPCRGSNGPFHVTSYYNHSWIKLFWNIGCSCSTTMLKPNIKKNIFFQTYDYIFCRSDFGRERTQI